MKHSVFLLFVIVLFFATSCVTPVRNRPMTEKEELQSSLVVAAKRGNIPEIEKLISQGVDVNGKDIYGGLPLIQAVLHHDSSLEAVKVLVKLGANVNVQDKLVITPLMCASANGRLDTLQWLIEHGSDVNRKDHYGDTALTAAIQSGETKVEKFLKSLGAQGELHPLLEAVCRNNKMEVARLLGEGVKVDLRFRKGTTALIWACRRGHYEIAELLIQSGANVNARDDEGGTALIDAAQKGHVKIIELLLRHGANPNLKTDYDMSALDTATAFRQDEIIKLLEEAIRKMDPSSKKCDNHSK